MNNSSGTRTVLLRFVLANVFSLTMFVFLGCGGGSDRPELGYVTGTVTMDGKPLPKVEVTFEPEEGRPSTGTTNDEGEFEMSYLGEAGAKIGKHVVTIITPAPEEEGSGCEEPEEGEGGFVDPIPLRYNVGAKDNPDMNVEVKEGDNHFEFKLTSDGPKATVGDPCGGFACPDLCE